MGADIVVSSEPGELENKCFEIKKIDNTFRIKENVISDKPKDDNSEINEVKKEKPPREKHILSKITIDRENGKISTKSYI